MFKTRKMKGKLTEVPGIGIFIVKLKEWIVAIQLEKFYTKKEILSMYLNTAEFGSNAYGIKVASDTYFKKSPSEINYNEAAILVGLINKPTKYNPIYNPEFAKRKRTEVLYNLYKYNKINRAEYDSLNSSSFGLKYKVENQNVGMATYFRTVVKNYLVQWSKENGYDLFADGLKIYTTINSTLQKYAEKSVENQMKKLQLLFDEHWENKNPWIDEKGFERLPRIR